LTLKLRRAFVHGIEEQQLIDGRDVECMAQGDQDRFVGVQSLLRDVAAMV
jgi:hypothetical protein